MYCWKILQMYDSLMKILNTLEVCQVSTKKKNNLKALQAYWIRKEKMKYLIEILRWHHILKNSEILLTYKILRKTIKNFLILIVHHAPGMFSWVRTLVFTYNLYFANLKSLFLIKRYTGFLLSRCFKEFYFIGVVGFLIHGISSQLFIRIKW